MKTLKKIVKFIVVVAIPIVTLSFYVYNIEQVFSLSILNIVICHLGILLTFFNAIFYSYHMSNTKIFNRFTASIVPAFGFLIGHHDSGSVQLLIGCVGLEFNYVGLYRKSTNSNLKKENRF
jgi:hypothetical protein